MSPGIPINSIPKPSPRVYVAAPFTEWPLVREVQAELRRRGATITCDWTLETDKSPTGSDASLSEAEAQDIAVADLEGIVTADAVLLLTVENKALGCGMWSELGFALGVRFAFGSPGAPLARSLLSDERCRIATCGPQRERTVFARLGKRFADWRDALPYVLGEAP